MNLFLLIGTHFPKMVAAVQHLPGLYPDHNVVLHLPNIQPAPNSHDSSKSKFQINLYTNAQDAIAALDASTAILNVFCIDPTRPLIAELDDIAAACSHRHIEPLKIITCVDCQLAETNGNLRDFLDAAIFHSDTVLLANHQLAGKKFVREFEKVYQRKCYPTSFLFLKSNGALSNPEEWLIHETRRLSRLFDLPALGEDDTSAIFPIEATCDLDVEDPPFDPFRHPDEDTPAPCVPSAASHLRWFNAEKDHVA